MSVWPVRRAYADAAHGQMHYAECGEARAGALPIVLLHQTPRSWLEYREVLPLLGARYRAIAMDTAGFGASDPLPGRASIEGWAAVAVQLRRSANGECSGTVADCLASGAVAIVSAFTLSAVLSPFHSRRERRH